VVDDQQVKFFYQILQRVVRERLQRARRPFHRRPGRAPALPAKGYEGGEPARVVPRQPPEPCQGRLPVCSVAIV
jgi:hypothetical protein